MFTVATHPTAPRTGNIKPAMERFDIQPVLSSSTTETANFLDRWHAQRNESSSPQQTIGQDSNSIEKRLHWLLIENPKATNAPQHGFCIRNTSGVMVGLLLCFANTFLAEDRRLLGLCSGSFFVDPSARPQGFYLFKKYLRDPSYDIFFSTTCNANSGPLWKAIGSSAVPNSEMEYILPLNLDVMLPALLAGKTSSSIATRIARVVGRMVGSIANPGRSRLPEFAVEPCQDWQKLSDLFRRHRPRSWITTDRSPGFLRWRYGPSSPNHPAEICLFHDNQGNEGWFALADTIRGRHRQIHGAMLLDAVWPRDKIHFKQILPAILCCQRVSTADAVFFQPRLGVDYRECSRLIIPRKLEGPQSFAVARKGAAPVEVSSLDLVPADGDSAF